VPTRYGRDLAVVIRQLKNDSRKFSKITQIERPATEEDLERARNNVRYEERAFLVCRGLINEHRLNMKLLTAHYLLEEPKIVFFYTAEKRVDFRGLLKDLVAYFKTRIELRQIGFRDDSRINGGIGVCGREFCCHAVFDRLKPISIKMAKEQKLSLNTNKISGPCEKLLCCLAYEHDFYMEQAKLLPPEGYKITYQGTLWKIIELNLLLGMATLETEDGKKTMLPKTQFEKNNDRWFVKNSGKGKGEKILQ
jgi:cell fate regulator YaaT (PSP1 superfamily)